MRRLARHPDQLVHLSVGPDLLRADQQANRAFRKFRDELPDERHRGIRLFRSDASRAIRTSLFTFRLAPICFAPISKRIGRSGNSAMSCRTSGTAASVSSFTANRISYSG